MKYSIFISWQKKKMSKMKHIHLCQVRYILRNSSCIKMKSRIFERRRLLWMNTCFFESFWLLYCWDSLTGVLEFSPRYHVFMDDFLDRHFDQKHCILISYLKFLKEQIWILSTSVSYTKLRLYIVYLFIYFFLSTRLWWWRYQQRRS